MTLGLSGAGLTVGANVVVNSTAVFVGNTTVNTVITSAGLTTNTVTYTNSSLPVNAETANVSVNTSGQLYHNLGATANVFFTLPTNSSNGCYNYFVVMAAQNFVIVTGNTTQQIYIGTSNTAAGGNVVSNQIGSSVQLVLVSNTKWIALSSTGQWTLN